MFIDLEKAYDNIALTKLWKALEETKTSYILITIVTGLHR
jgi:hypothetical protein